MNNNPEIAHQVYEECINSWRSMQLGLFYARIPYLLDHNCINQLIERFEFPIININKDYKLDKNLLPNLIKVFIFICCGEPLAHHYMV